MKQPILGEVPAPIQEVTVMTVWPSLSATSFGRFWGRLFALEFGFRLFGVPITVGRLMALVSIPFMLALYFLMRLPRFPGVLIGFRNRLIVMLQWAWAYLIFQRGARLITGAPKMELRTPRTEPRK